MAAPDSCTISFTELRLTRGGIDVIAAQFDRLWNTWRVAPLEIRCSYSTVAYIVDILSQAYGSPGAPARRWSAPLGPGPVGEVVNPNAGIVPLVWDPDAADGVFTFVMAPAEELVLA